MSSATQYGAPATNHWKWVVLASSFLSHLVCTSVGYNVGVVNVAVLDHFPGASRETVSWLMSSYSSLFALAAPLGSTIVNATSCRVCLVLSGILCFLGMVCSSFVTRLDWLFLTLTVSGIGQSLAQVGATVGLLCHFPDKASLATGIAVTGAGLGSFMHPWLFQVLLDHYGFAGAFLIVGAVSLNASMLGMLQRPAAMEVERRAVRPVKREPIAKSAKIAIRSYADVLGNVNFLKVLVATFTFAAAFQAAVIYLPEFLVNSRGFGHLQAAAVASFVGVGTLVSRPLVGCAASDSNIGELLMFTGLSFVSFLVGMAADGLTRSEGGAYITALAIGAYGSTCNVLIFPLVILTLGHEKSSTGFGLAMMTFGTACLVWPPFVSFVMKEFGYVALFRLSALMFLMTAAIGLSISRPSKSSVRNGNHNNDLCLEVVEDGSGLCSSQNFEFTVYNSGEKKNDAGVLDPAQKSVLQNVKHIKSNNGSLNETSINDKLQLEENISLLEPGAEHDKEYIKVKKLNDEAQVQEKDF